MRHSTAAAIAPTTTKPRAKRPPKTTEELIREFDALPLDALADTKQVAAYLRISHQKLEADRTHGRGCPFVKIGKGPRACVRYVKRDVLNWIEGKIQRSTSQTA